MSQQNAILQLRRWIFRDGAPITRSLMLVLGVSLILYFLLSGNLQARLFFYEIAWTSDDGLRRPWTLVTYAFTWVGGPSAIWTALWVGLSLFYFGASLERGIGFRRFLLFTAVITVAVPLSLLVGANLPPRATVAAATFSLPATCYLVGWAARSKEATIYVWGVLPIRAKWLSLASFVMVLVIYGFGSPLRGVCAIVPLAIAHFWASGHLPSVNLWAKGSDRQVSTWERRRQEELERMRLKELFERSYRLKEEDIDEDK